MSEPPEEDLDEVRREVLEPLLGEDTRKLQAICKETVGVSRELLAKLHTIPPPSGR